MILEKKNCNTTNMQASHSNDLVLEQKYVLICCQCVKLMRMSSRIVVFNLLPDGTLDVTDILR